MSDLRLGIRVEAVLENSPDPDEVLQEMLEETGAFEPYTIVVPKEYAMYVEFGSGPARRVKAPGVNVYEELDDWVRDKLGIVDPKKRRRVTGAVYHKIMEEGIPPQPFLRPAVRNVIDRLSPSWFSDGGSVEELARLIVREMRNILETENINYSKQLSDSIIIKEGEYYGDEPSNIPIEVWNDPERGLEGKKAVHRGTGGKRRR